MVVTLQKHALINQIFQFIIIFNAKKKPLTIVSKSAARIAAVQIFYNTIISKRNISDVFQDYIISFKVI